MKVTALLLLDLDQDERDDLMTFRVQLPSLATIVLGLVKSIDIDVRAVGYQSDNSGFASTPKWRRTITIRIPPLLSLLSRQDELVERFTSLVNKARMSARGEFSTPGTFDLAIVTTDNTEAAIRVGERRAIPTTTATTIGGSVQSSFEYENIGLELTVTPRINPQGIVILEITQTADNVAGNTIIDWNEVPIITSREMEASVAIRSGGTLALGGLVREDQRESVSKVPFFSSIPILGALFRSTSKETVRTELLVLISPEVLVSAEEAENLTRQLKKATELNDAKWYRGWDLPPKEECGKENDQ